MINAPKMGLKSLVRAYDSRGVPLEVQRLPAGCAGMGDLAAVCSPPVRFPLVMPAQKAFATTFASRPPALKPLR